MAKVHLVAEVRDEFIVVFSQSVDINIRMKEGTYFPKPLSNTADTIIALPILSLPVANTMVRTRLYVITLY
jgi:hypothetical protein